MVSGIVG